MSKEEARKVVSAILSPHNIGRLRQAIENMPDDTPVFNFEWGNTEGVCGWKRKESWKQWVKKQQPTTPQKEGLEK